MIEMSENQELLADVMKNWHTIPEHNADFFITEINEFYVYVLKHFNYTISRPLVFLPCSKTKPYSSSLTHCYMSAITRDPNLEKIVISEPLSIVPYMFEHLAPKYDYPPSQLHKKDRMVLLRRLGMFLLQLHEKNQQLKVIYYIGGKHHYNLLKDANHNIFIIKAIIPKKGIRDYAKSAKVLKKLIYHDMGWPILRQKTL